MSRLKSESCLQHDQHNVYNICDFLALHCFHSFFRSFGSYPPYSVDKLPGSYPPWRVTPAGALNGAKDKIVKFAFMLSLPSSFLYLVAETENPSF